MNFRLVFRIVGRVLLLLPVGMVPSLLIALYYGENPVPFLLSMLVIGGVGGALTMLPSKQDFYAREGFFAVGLIWFVIGIAGGLPFYFSGYFASPVDCIFESVSGFTTTGATVLTSIESLPYGILFWRAFTHWIGGMGVLVLTTALVPSMGIRSQYLTMAESPGPVFSKLVPKQSQSSKILYSIYCALTVVEAVCLRLTGLPWYDSFLHAISSAGTGGFSNRNASVGAYNNPAAEVVIAVFLLIFSINFAVHFLILTGRAREAFKSDELRFFLTIVAVTTIFATLVSMPRYTSALECLRRSFFAVCSIISTTGFATSDYNFWPMLTQMTLILLMICGGCAGSTAGGVKASRVLLAGRCIRREVGRIIHPRTVEVVRLDGHVVEERTLGTVMIYLVTHVAIIFFTALLVSVDDFSFGTSLSAAFTCASNTGPGVEAIGPMGNFSAFSPFSKITLVFSMIIGRLEIFPVLILFSPSTWRRI